MACARCGSTRPRDRRRPASASAWPRRVSSGPASCRISRTMEMTKYSQSLLAMTPYVSGLYDNVDDDSDFDAGADMFWKPNGQFQLTATLNPDFGQVESDDLVVNFERDRNLHQRQAAVLHREPGHLRIHHAVRFQPAPLHPPCRRARRRRQRRRRHHRGGQAQRQHRRDQVRRVRRRRSRRSRTLVRRAAPGARLQRRRIWASC